MTKPAVKPQNPCFSSGPCAKRPGWNLAALKDAAVGRSHRATVGRAKLQEVIERSRALLGVPADYRIGVVPGSDTGAVEMCLWSMLGARGVDVLSWESFSKGWVTDITRHLRLEDVRVFDADFGELPDLSLIDCDRDVVFAWNGTTSGVKVPDGEWIAADREGLTICDATSVVFAVDLPWEKLDVVTYSWQKVMGGEAAHGMLILSPRAVERLLSFTPPWPVPKLFRMTQGGQLNEALFKGRHHQHALPAVRGRRTRRAALGRTHRRLARTRAAHAGQPRGARAVGSRKRVDRVFARAPSDSL